MESAEPVVVPEAPNEPIPPLIRSAMAVPPLERKGWEWTSGPFYIGLFLWIVYFDRIPTESTVRGGVFCSCLGILIGGLLSAFLLYWIPATLGFQTGKNLTIISTSTFGVRGACWMPARLAAFTCIIMMALAVFYSTDLCLKAFVLLELLDPRLLSRNEFASFSTPSTLFLITAFLWALASAFTGKYLIRVIAALMNVFQILPALLLGLCAAKALPGLPYFRPTAIGMPELDLQTGLTAMLIGIQMVMGYFAVSGLASVDWGGSMSTPKDLSRTGTVGVAMASTIIGVLSILTIAGAAGTSMERGEKVEVISLSFVGALPLLFNARTTAFCYLGFGLAALAPSCYGAFVFGSRMHEIRPRRSRTWWTFVAVFGAWIFILLGLPNKLLASFGLLGAIAAPIVGAMSADYYRSKGTWQGPRNGLHRPGLLAWFGGFLVGLIPIIGGWFGSPLERLQPATLYAFLTSFVLYLILSKLGLGSEPDAHHEILSGSES